MTSEEVLNKLQKQYCVYYDVRSGIEHKSMPFALEADFHSSSEKYVLVKSAQLWRYENHEYVYIAAVSDLNQENFIKYKDTVLCEGLTRVKPHKEHMYTHITLVLVADNIEPTLFKLISKTHFHKDFKCSFHGWVDFRLVAFECSSGSVVSNRQGGNLKRLFDDNEMI